MKTYPCMTPISATLNKLRLQGLKDVFLESCHSCSRVYVWAQQLSYDGSEGLMMALGTCPDKSIYQGLERGRYISPRSNVLSANW